MPLIRNAELLGVPLIWAIGVFGALSLPYSSLVMAFLVASGRRMVSAIYLATLRICYCDRCRLATHAVTFDWHFSLVPNPILPERASRCNTRKFGARSNQKHPTVIGRRRSEWAVANNMKSI